MLKRPILPFSSMIKESRNVFVEAYANLQMKIIAYKLSTNQL